MIRQSTGNDLPSIKALLQNVFHDSGRFINLLFRYKYRDNALVYESNGEIVSVAFLLPAKLIINHRAVSITYLYACATEENHRCCGYMGEIINTAFHTVCRHQEAGLFLLPANDTLVNYYQKFQFQPFFERKLLLDTTLTCNHFHHLATNSPIERVDAAQYANLRREYFSLPCSIQWDDAHFKLLEADTEDRRPYFIKYQSADRSWGIAFCCLEKESLTVSELLGNVNVSDFAEALHKEIPFRHIRIYVPGTGKPYGMIRLTPDYLFLQNEKGYFAFALE